jgi:uncharacterized protein (TIGR03067 family)
MLKTTFPLLALCALVTAGRSDDVDPEPPGGSAEALRALKGTWTVTRGVFGNRESKAPPGLTYTFDGDKLTRALPFGKAKGNVKGKDDGKQTYKVKLDTKKKPYQITMTPDGGGQAQSGIFKVEKGELFLATARGKDAKTPADFSGGDVAVMVMTKEKGKEKDKK